MMTQNRQFLFVLFLITALVTAFWWPTLFGGKTLIHGDSVVHGLPLMDLHARALHGEASLLWSARIYGGHPLFAEGQGAFAHPLNILLAALVPPAYGYNLFHFICMLLLAVGTYGLCRSLGTSVFAAGFAALAASFADINVGAQHNMTIGGTLTWVPWALWAFERWLQRPDLYRASVLAVACSLMVLAGYPQVFHGTVLYMAATLLAVPFSSVERCQWRGWWPRLLASGAFAVVLCIGLVAVQLLPLLELTMRSHRAEGVGLLLPLMPRDAIAYLRGLLFTLTELEGPKGGYVPIVGSVLVCAAAALCLLFRTSVRAKGHILATLLLMLLGIGVVSPVFRVVYEYHLLPGLSFFRGTFTYLNLACVGVAVLAALGIDALVASCAQRGVRWNLVKLLAVAVVLLALAVAVYAEGMPYINVIVAAFAFAGVSVLILLRRGSAIPTLLMLMLAAECVALHLHEFGFADTKVLAKPSTYAQFAAIADIDDYRFTDVTARAGYVFVNSRHPELGTFMQYVMATYAAMTNLMFDMSSINAALALPIKARVLLEPVFRDEQAGLPAAPPGQRAIDLLGVRYIAANSQTQMPGFSLVAEDKAYPTKFFENTAAKPRFQAWTRHVAVRSTEDAVALIRTARDDALIIEADAATLPPATERANQSDSLHLTVRKATSTRYEFDVDADTDGWLFVADANYPGWKASVDDAQSHVYTANVLGKAVRVPKGQHRVVLYFESATFRIGLVSTIVSLLVVVSVGIYAWRTRGVRARTL